MHSLRSSHEHLHPHNFQFRQNRVQKKLLLSSFLLFLWHVLLCHYCQSDGRLRHARDFLLLGGGHHDGIACATFFRSFALLLKLSALSCLTLFVILCNTLFLLQCLLLLSLLVLPSLDLGEILIVYTRQLLHLLLVNLSALTPGQSLHQRWIRLLRSKSLILLPSGGHAGRVVDHSSRVSGVDNG